MPFGARMGTKRQRMRNSVLGLDLGRRAVKAVEIERVGKRLSVVGCAYEAVDPDKGPEAGPAAAVRAVLAAGPFGTGNIVAGFSGRGTVLAGVNLPKNSDVPLPEAVRGEAARLVPYDLGDAELDYQILDSEHLPQLRLLVAAARREDVLDRLDAFFAAGVHPARLVPEAVALANAFETANMDGRFLSDGRAAAVVNFGAGKTLITVTDGSTHVFRDFPMGSDAFTEMIARRLDCPAGEAERAKLNPGGRLDMIKDAVYPGVEDITAEIRSCIGRFRSASEGGEVGLLLLSGSLVMFPGIPALIGRIVGVETRIFAGFGAVDAGGLDKGFLLRHGHELALAFGLACHARE